ncbi:Cupin-like domain-containing protein [Marinobacter sp. es.042]|uniref:cupin-like domain-containing protein n=1 Tax=Marinobacter sp. es.042 TaxID=1761794 RepID=UPI000B50444F|nr:cupin-like domain-containing protein [Marinobacter sp. es.042]SNB55507.1 Cupin-like domain-containing protein [Marinobacter sp. es.042]
MAGVFLDQLDEQELDVSPFKLQHTLLDNEALTLDSLKETLLRLPKEQVFYKNSRLSTQDNFEAAFKKNDTDLSLESTLRDLKQSNSLIMVNSPEVDPVFQPIYQRIMESIEELVAKRDPKRRIFMPTLYLFIASPNSITPFHIDRYSTFLFQFRGSKKVFVAEPWDTRVVSDASREAYMSYASTDLQWSNEKERLFTCFDFRPGEALHIPFVSGHHVKNGPDDISISMSVIFNTRNSMMLRRALNFNHRARKLMSPFNIAPHPVGRSEVRDSFKSGLWRSWLKMRATI